MTLGPTAAAKSQFSFLLRLRCGVDSPQRFHLQILRSRLERDPPLSALPKFVSAFRLPSPATGLRSAGLSTSASRGLSPQEAGDGPRVSPRGGGKPEAVAGGASRLSEAVLEGSPPSSSAEPPATAPS